MFNAAPTEGVGGKEPTNVADLLARQAQFRPDAVAIIHPGGNVTYRTLDARVWSLCGYLHDRGLTSGDVVGLHVSDTLIHLTWLLALARSGMPTVAVSAAGGDLAASQRILERTAARAIIDSGKHDWGLPIRVDASAAAYTDIRVTDPLLRCADMQRVLIYKTSSGTTGVPKIVASTHAGMIASIEREQMAIGYPEGERYLTAVAITHDGPRRRVLACLASGGTVVLPHPGANAAEIIDLIDRHDVRHFSSVAVQALQLALALPAGRQRFPQMRCLRLSAGPSDASLHKLLRDRLTDQVLVSYGCTELGPITVADSQLLARQPQTVGYPMPGVEVDVVDAKGCSAPNGVIGEIRIRAVGMPSGYHDDPATTARSFRDGWFYPGDLGRVETDGKLIHLGRSDDMMIFNGINIAPAEIEQTMLKHPAVRDAVALPLKHRVSHQIPVCAVVLNADRPVTSEELLKYAHRQLGVRGPKVLAILDEIPRNEFGKVRRADLQTRVLNDLATKQTRSEAGS